MLRETLAKESSAPSLPQSDITVSECIRQWLESTKRRADEVTYLGYLHTATAHILPYFDATGLKLRDCTTTALQACFDEKHLHGRKDGKGGLSSKTMRHRYSILLQSLAKAVKDGLLRSNPCEAVELPRRERYEASFYSAEQLQTLFEVIWDDPLLPLVRITALYGLRRSAVLGLKWDSIDFDNRCLTIRHTVCKMLTTVEKDTTKAQSSHRSFPLTDEAYDIFQTAKA